MGLFDTIEGALPGMPGPGGAPQGVLPAVLQMIQAQPGGIAGVLQKFESGGFGGVAQSWLGGGANQAIAPDQVQQALGDNAVGQVATQLGVSQDEAAGHIAEFLPQILDHVSPNGQAPAGGGLQEIEGLLSRFGGART